MAERLGPPPKKADERFDNWVFRLWKRAFGALNSGDVGVTAPITITTSGTGTVNIGHGTSGVTSGTYGSASVIPQVVVDTYGHVTSVGTNAVAISGTAITGTDLVVSSPLTGTATNALLRSGTIGHGTSGAIPGTYGNQSTVPIVAVNTWGHVTLATSSAIAINGTAVTGNDVTFNSPILGTLTNAVLRAGAISHATSGIVPGTFGGASVVPQVVVNTYGHVMAVNTLNIAVAGTAVTGADLTVSSPLTGTATNALLRAGTIGHGTSGVTPGTFGASGTVGQFVVDTYGHITSAAGVQIDHGSVGGLSDDDHTQYVLANGARAITGTQTMANVAIATAANVTATTPILVSGTTTSAVLHPFAIAHATSGIVPGTFGSISIIPQVVVDTYGHVTAVNTFGLTGTAVTGADLTINSPLQGTVTNALLRSGAISHAVSGVVASTYGGALGLARVIVNTYGHITAGTSFPLQATSPILLGSNAGTFTWGHSTSGIVTGTYGAATIIPQVVVNTWGHVTAINTFALTGTAVSGNDVSVTSPITISGTSTNAVLRPFTIAHATSGITPGTFGDASTIPQIVVNTYGHVTAVNTLAATASPEHSRQLTAHTTMGTYASRVYASELILGTYDLNIPSTSFVVTVG